MCDVPLYDAVTAIAGTEVSPGRMRVHHLASGAIVVDDAYNANPVSMRAGLDALAAIDARRRVAVLGVMAELAEPDAAHREIATASRRSPTPPRHSVRSRGGRPCS